MTWTFAEANPFSKATGNFDTMLKNIVESVRNLPCGSKVEVRQYDATKMVFPTNSVLFNTRVNRDVNNYVQEIIQHLQAVEGSEVELTLEVNVHAPKGIPSSTVRTVAKNCRTLKVTEFGFED